MPTNSRSFESFYYEKKNYILLTGVCNPFIEIVYDACLLRRSTEM